MRSFLSFVFMLLISVVSGSFNCSKYDFPCEDDECVDMGLWCDSHKDCSDGSDEKYCTKSSSINNDPNKCPSNYFKCNNGPCIPKVGRCDGYESCDDSSDEKNCGRLNSYSKSNGTIPLANYAINPFETHINSTIKTSTRTATSQPRMKVEPKSTYLSDSPSAEQDSIERYPYFDHSDYSNERERAREWLLSQRNGDYGWGDETPRALTALYLSDVQLPIDRNENDMLMVKQLEVQLSLDISRNGTKTMKLANIALYINALLSSCQDPKNFYGENLVNILRDGVNVAHRQRIFINPSIYLTLCLNNATSYEDARNIHEILSSENAAIGRTDVQAIAILALTCIKQKTNYLSSYIELERKFIQKMSAAGIPGNVYEASLLLQALHGLETTLPGLLEFTLQQQQADGSFGGILATYLVLPVLAGRTFLQMNEHCSQHYSTDLAPIQVLKNVRRKKINVHYSLKHGNPPGVTEIILMQVAEGINFLDVMRLAQEINPKFRFKLDENHEVPVVYSIGGIPNDAEKGMFWTLHLTPYGRDSRHSSLYKGNIKQLIPHPGDELSFWLKSL